MRDTRAIRCLNEWNAYSNWLRSFDWKYFVTFTTHYELSFNSARRLMERYFQRLMEAGGTVTLFWVAERYELKDGCHLHALLIVPDCHSPQALNELYQVVSAAKRNNQKFRADFSPYDKARKGSDYLLKNLPGPGEIEYDILIAPSE